MTVLSRPEQRSGDTLYAPTDALAAHKAWGANCGPAALAAVLSVDMARVRRLFPDFARKPWVNPSTMWTALALAGRKAIKRGTQWPTYGLAFVQLHGPWMATGVPVAAAYRYTHWVAVAATLEYGTMLYDINANAEGQAFPGAWVPVRWWADEVLPVIADEVPRATGEWSLRWTCEVLPVAKSSPSAIL